MRVFKGWVAQNWKCSDKVQWDKSSDPELDISGVFKKKGKSSLWAAWEKPPKRVTITVEED